MIDGLGEGVHEDDLIDVAGVKESKVIEDSRPLFSAGFVAASIGVRWDGDDRLYTNYLPFLYKHEICSSAKSEMYMLEI